MLHLKKNMIKVLINAYACAPNMGSEPGMAWNWCVNLAKYCELYIITEGEFREEIEKALPSLTQSKNMHFYYNPLSEDVRKMCWNQGDWRFYRHYKYWQNKTYEIALELIDSKNINIVHQLNMIGFREPGYLWKIKEVPFVWGPIGGLKQMPLAFLKNTGIKMNLFNRLKNELNILQLKYDKRVNLSLRQASILISSIPDSYHAIKKYKNLESIIIPETGCYLKTQTIDSKRFDNSEFHVMWVGKFDFRKQLPLALKSLALTNNKKIILNIFGTGNSTQLVEAIKITTDLNILDQVVWHGKQPNDVVQKKNERSSIIFIHKHK